MILSVRETPIRQPLLTACFTLAELEVLRERPAFQKMAANMKTMEDFESLVLAGHRLLLERDRMTPSAPSPRPEARRDRHAQRLSQA